MTDIKWNDEISKYYKYIFTSRAGIKDKSQIWSGNTIRTLENIVFIVPSFLPLSLPYLG